MSTETDYDLLKRESPQETLDALRRVYADFMHTLEARADLKGKYVLLRTEGDTIAFVTAYDRDRFDPNTLTLEQDLILLEMPEDPEAEVGLHMDGSARWRMRNILEEYGDALPVVRDDGIIFEPDYSQLSPGDARQMKEAHKRRPR